MEMKGNSSDSRVPYDSEQKQFINIVGESHFQEGLALHKRDASDAWANGVLIPEPDNKFDLIVPEGL